MKQLTNTVEGKCKARFDLFVRLYQDSPSVFPKNQRVHTFRGDRFTDKEEKMLTNLMNICRKDYKKYFLMIISDNQFQKGDEEKDILVVKKNKVIRNVLEERYPFAFENMKWPEWLKKHVYVADQNLPR